MATATAPDINRIANRVRTLATYGTETRPKFIERIRDLAADTDAIAKLAPEALAALDKYTWEEMRYL